MKNKYNKNELATIYFALIDRLNFEKGVYQEENYNKIVVANRIDYLNKLINKIEQHIESVSK